MTEDSVVAELAAAIRAAPERPVEWVRRARAVGATRAQIGAAVMAALDAGATAEPPAGAELLTVDVVAAVMRRNPSRVRLLAAQGRLRAWKREGTWYIEAASVREYMAARGDLAAAGN